jgi:hypothetical protein
VAAFKVLADLLIVGAAALAFLVGWLTINAAVVLTVLLLGSSFCSGSTSARVATRSSYFSAL